MICWLLRVNLYTDTGVSILAGEYSASCSNVRGGGGDKRGRTMRVYFPCIFTFQLFVWGVAVEWIVRGAQQLRGEYSSSWYNVRDWKMETMINHSAMLYYDERKSLCMRIDYGVGGVL